MATPIEERPLAYNTVAAGQTAQALVKPASTIEGTAAGVGARGDVLESITIFPAVAAAGAVSILDGTTTIATFPGGGTTALPTLVPFTVPLCVRSQTGPWKITTGANVSVVANGRFT